MSRGILVRRSSFPSCIGLPKNQLITIATPSGGNAENHRSSKLEIGRTCAPLRRLCGRLQRATGWGLTRNHCIHNVNKSPLCLGGPPQFIINKAIKEEYDGRFNRYLSVLYNKVAYHAGNLGSLAVWVCTLPQWVKSVVKLANSTVTEWWLRSDTKFTKFAWNLVAKTLFGCCQISVGYCP